MDIGQAIAAIKEGKRAVRSGWNGKDMWIAYSAGSAALPADKFWSEANKRYAIDNGGAVKVNASMTIRNPDGSISFWAPSMGDALAEDWEILT